MSESRLGDMGGGGFCIFNVRDFKLLMFNLV